MSIRFRPAWLWTGAIGALFCMLDSAELVNGYIRHMSTGDQAGAGLGMMFLLLWLLPAATVPILMSVQAREPVPDPSQPERRGPGWASRLLLACGWLMIAFTLLYVAFQMPRSIEAASRLGPARALYFLSHIGLLLGLGGAWIGFGSTARHAAPPRWLAPLLLFTAAAALVLNANMLIESFRGVYPGQDRWSLFARNLVYFCVPSLVLVMLLVRTAWTLKPMPLPAAARPEPAGPVSRQRPAPEGGIE